VGLLSATHCTLRQPARDGLAIEWEFESLEEHEEYWADWSARPETPAFAEKLYELTERGGAAEIWDLRE
jgi:hypothetical protein